MAGRPKTQGPHWPALSPAMYRATRAVSATPHDVLGRAMTMPTPDEAPAAASGAGRIGRGQPAGVEPGTPVPADQDAPTRHRSTPARSRMSATGVPSSTSTTPGKRTAPLTVTSVDPGSVRRSQASEPLGAVPGDESHLGQRLGVVHQDRATAHARAGPTCRSQGGNGAPLVEPPDQCRLLAASRSGPGAVPRVTRNSCGAASPPLGDGGLDRRAPGSRRGRRHRSRSRRRRPPRPPPRRRPGPDGVRRPAAPGPWRWPARPPWR